MLQTELVASISYAIRISRRKGAVIAFVPATKRYGRSSDIPGCASRPDITVGLMDASNLKLNLLDYTPSTMEYHKVTNGRLKVKLAMLSHSSACVKIND